MIVTPRDVNIEAVARAATREDADGAIAPQSAATPCANTSPVIGPS